MSAVSLLIPQEEWERDKGALCEAYGLELDPRKALDLQYELLRVGLADVEVGLEKGLLEIDDEGCVRIPAIRAAEEDPELRHTNQRLSDSIGATQLPEVILEIDSRTQISTMLLGRQPEDAEELIALYAGLLAHGTEIDAKAAAAMIPGVPVSRVTAAMRMLEAPGRLRAANDAVVAFQQRFPIVKLWSDGKKASSDMMALDATRHLSIARTDPRRKTAAAGIYTHILGSYPVIFDQPIVLMTRQDAPAVHGIEAYNSNSEDRIKVDLLAVDTLKAATMAAVAHQRSEIKLDMSSPDNEEQAARALEVPQATLRRSGMSNAKAAVLHSQRWSRRAPQEWRLHGRTLGNG